MFQPPRLIYYLSYMYRNPVYHQAVFATLIIGSALRVRDLLRRPEIQARIPPKQRSDIATSFAAGSALFAFGFLIWNLDNIYCDTLTGWKVAVGWPSAFLLEGNVQDRCDHFYVINLPYRACLVAHIDCELHVEC
jgi:dihydroceramidase